MTKNKEKEEIPLVDLSDYFSSDMVRRALFVNAFGDALRSFGFVRLTGHNVSDELLELLYDSMRKLFSNCDKHLRDYHVPAIHGQTGYTPYGKEQAVGYKQGDAKRFWHVCRESERSNIWPSESLAPKLKTYASTLYRRLDEVFIILCQALEEYLQLGTNSVALLVMGDNNSTLRLLHYPKQETVRPAKSTKRKRGLRPRRARRSVRVRAGAHRDINWLTLLPAATSSGLQVRRRNGRWLPIKASKGEIIVNAGIMLERFTNGYIKATEHQVVNPDDEIPNVDRFSTPFFGHPCAEAVICVPKRFRGPGYPRAKPAITARKALQQVLKAIKLA